MKFLKNFGGAMAPPLVSVAPPLHAWCGNLKDKNEKRKIVSAIKIEEEAKEM